MKNLLYLFLFVFFVSSCCQKDCCKSGVQPNLIAETYFVGEVDLKATDDDNLGLIKIDFGHDVIKYAIYEKESSSAILPIETPVYVKVGLDNNIPVVTELKTGSVDKADISMDIQLSKTFKLDFHGFFKIHPGSTSHSKIHRVRSEVYQSSGLTLINAEIDENNPPTTKDFYIIGTIQQNGINAVPDSTLLYYEFIPPSSSSSPVPIVRVDTTHHHTQY